MAGHGPQRRRPVHLAVAALHRADRRHPAEQVQRVGGVARRADPRDHVGHRGVAVAQRSVGVGGPAGQLDRCRQQHRLERGEVAVARGEPQPRGGDVGLGTREQVVVHLHDHLRAGLERDADVVGHHLLAAAGRPGAEPRGVVEAAAGPADAGAAEAGPALPGLGVVRRPGCGHRAGRHPEQDHVVDDALGARQHVQAGDEGVLGERGVEQEAAVVVGAGAGGRRRGVRRRHRQPGEPLPRAQRRRGRRAGVGVVGRRDRPGPPRPGPRRRWPGRRRQARPCSRRAAAPPSRARPGRRRRGASRPVPHPGGQVIVRPPSTCRWAWKTVWCAEAPVLKTSR